MFLYSFSASRYTALAAIIKLRTVGPKRFGTNKFERTKSHAGSTFSKISLEPFCTWALQLCIHIAVFFCGVRWRIRRAPNSEPHVLVNFVAVWRIASPIVDRFGRSFHDLLEYQMYLATRATYYSYIGRYCGATRFAKLWLKFSSRPHSWLLLR